MEENSNAVIAALVRLDGAPPALPVYVPFSGQQTSVTVGRLESNNVVLVDKRVSKMHCRLTLRQCKQKGVENSEVMKRIFVRDMSSFGTFVNGTAVQKEQWVILQEGDVLGLRNPHGNAQLGEYRAQYTNLEGIAPPAAGANGQSQPHQPVEPVAVAPAAHATPPVAVSAPVHVPATAQALVPEALASSAASAAGAGVQRMMPAGSPSDPPTVGVPLEQPVEVRVGDAGASMPAALPFAQPPSSVQLQATPEPVTLENVAAPPSPLSECSEVSAPDAPNAAAPALGATAAQIPLLGTGLLGASPLLGALPGLPGTGLLQNVQMPLLGGTMPLLLDPASLPGGVQPGFLPGVQGLAPLGRPPALTPQLILPVGTQTVPAPPPPNLAAMIPSMRAAEAKGAAAALAGQNRPPPVAISVEEELVGKIIGRGGEIVKQLQRESGARIDVSKVGADTPAGKRIVYVSGTQACIDRAKSMIDDTLNKARDILRGGNPNGCVVKVSSELIGKLIGRGGEMIKELEKESGARLDIRRDPTNAEHPDERMVHITGPQDCVEYAKKAVEQRLGLSGDRQLAIADVPKVEPPAPIEDVKSGRSTQVTIQIQQDLTRLLIGRGGDTINMISKQCGVRIEIARGEAAERADKRAVYITGPLDGIDRAKHMISETLRTSREKHRDSSRSRSRSRERSRSRDRSVSRSRGDPAQTESSRKVLSMSQESVGMLIGKGGETIIALTKDTGAKIEVSKDDNHSDRQVILSGSAAQIEKATAMIEDTISKARERQKTRSSKQSDRRSRSRSRGRRSQSRGRDRDRRDADEYALMPLDRRSPLHENIVTEKVYVDECDMPFRPNFLPEHEDGLPADLEIFVRGLPKALAERDLWEHLCRLGASDVKEILLLRRQKVSKGMAYVVFNRHDHAVMAKHKLHGCPASAIPCGGKPLSDERGTLMVRFSESERCVSGRSCVYGTDMAGLLLGTRGKNMEHVKDISGLRKVLLTGRSMRSYGEVDDDPRLHLVVQYEIGEVDNVAKGIAAWGEQLSGIHKEIVEKSGKGKGKGFPHMPIHPHMPMPPPFPMLGYPPMHPPAQQNVEKNVETSEENPVLMQRRQLAAASADEPDKLVVSGPKVAEATCLKGQELRWQPWPDVTSFNQDWALTPLRWGQRGELFALLRKRENGKVRVCAADVRQPMEKWMVLNTPSVAAKKAKHWSFTFKDHLFVIAIDRESGSLKVFHLADPAAPWSVAYETILTDGGDNDASEGIDICRNSKLHVFYAPDRLPHVVAINPKGEKGAAATVFCIADPGKSWVKCSTTPALSAKARVMSVYTRTKPGSTHDFDVALFSVDPDESQIHVHLMPTSSDQPWMLMSSLPFRGDSRLCCTYVPGKPEPVLMAGSPTERTLKLCHLNLLQWLAAKRTEAAELPQVPVLEEKLSRQMSSIWPQQLRPDAGQAVVAIPMDCTMDLPVSRHAWITTPAAQVEGFKQDATETKAVGSTAQPQQQPDPGSNSTPPDAGARPPPERPPAEQSAPPPRGPGPCADSGPPGIPPGFGMPPPGFGRPPFDDGKGGCGPGPCGPYGPMGKGYPGGPCHGHPMGGPMGKGYPPFGPPGFGPMPPYGPGGPGGPYGRPPMDHHPFGRPPFAGPGDPMHYRPPFDHGKGGPPPYGMPPGHMIPPGWPPRPGMPPGPGLPPGQAGGPLGAPPSGADAGAASFDALPRAAGDPSQWAVGQLVEADFKASGQWQLAKITAKLQNGTFDVEYRGDYMEWQVPANRLRVAGPGGPPPPGAQPPVEAGAADGGPAGKATGGDRHSPEKDRDRDRRRRRDASEDGGEKKHRRRRHRRSDKDRDRDRDRDRDKDSD